MVKPPPPVYAPEVVADTIVFAARHPRREIPVGGAAAALMRGQRPAPGLTDAVLAIRRFGVDSQRTARPDNGVDNLDAASDGPGRVHGSHPGTVLRHSPFTRLLGRRSRPGDLATAVVRLLHRPRRSAADPAVTRG